MNYQNISLLQPIREKLNIFSGLQIFLDGKVNQNHVSGAQGQMTGLVAGAADYDESFDAIIDRTFGSNTSFEPWRLLDGNSSPADSEGQNGKTPSVSPNSITHLW